MINNEKQIYPPFYPDLRVSHANGVYVFDKINKKKYIDLSASAGMAIIGYGHRRIRTAIKKQADKLIISPQKYRTKEAEILIKKILELFSEEYNTVMPAVTGSEAVEIAMQTTINCTGRNKILSWDNAYHGHTIATRSLGEKDEKFGLLGELFSAVSPPKNKTAINKTLEIIEKKLATKKYAAFITEGVITNAGYWKFPRGFIKKLAVLCDKYHTFLIFDEVLTGFGRTGKMFSFERHDIKPDIVCLAKGLASGHAAIAAVVTRNELVKGYDYFSTFAWPPLSCAIAAVNIDIIEKEELVRNSASLGRYALTVLKHKLGNCHLIKEITGVGLGISLKFRTKDDAIRIHQKCLKAGVMLFRNINLNMLFIQPPLIITKAEIKQAIKIIVYVIVSYKNR